MLAGVKINRICVTNGLTIPLQGRAILIYRTNTNKAIEMKNVVDVIETLLVLNELAAMLLDL